MMAHWKLAGRNVWRQRTRFRILLIALVLGGAAVTSVLGVSQGMIEVLRGKAASFFAGHVTVLGFLPNQMNPRTKDMEILENALRKAGPENLGITVRSVYYQANAKIFFGGDFVRQRRVVGLEWARESEALESMDWSDGGVPSFDDETAVILSATVAKKLNVRVGDDCVLTLNTITGQQNTVKLIVRGIFRDPSFFGYTVYLKRETLNKSMREAPDLVNEMGVLLKPGQNQEVVARRLREILQNEVTLFPPILSKAQLYEELNTKWDGTKYAILTLDAHLAQIKDIVDALFYVTLVLVFMFLTIVCIGVSNSYTMVIQERTKEIGTIRSLGMTKQALLSLLLKESFWIGLIGALGGVILGLMILGSLQFLDLEQVTFVSLFIRRGNLVPLIDMASLVLILGVVLLATTLGAIRPALKGISLSPADALREE